MNKFKKWLFGIKTFEVEFIAKGWLCNQYSPLKTTVTMTRKQRKTLEPNQQAFYENYDFLIKHYKTKNGKTRFSSITNEIPSK